MNPCCEKLIEEIKKASYNHYESGWIMIPKPAWDRIVGTDERKARHVEEKEE